MIVARCVGFRSCGRASDFHERARRVGRIGRDHVLENDVDGGIQRARVIIYCDRVAERISGDHLATVHVDHALHHLDVGRIELDRTRDHTGVILVLSRRQPKLSTRRAVIDDAVRRDEIRTEAELIHVVGVLCRHPHTTIGDRAVEKIIGRIQGIRKLHFPRAPVEVAAVPADTKVALVGDQPDRGLNRTVGRCDEAAEGYDHISIGRGIANIGEAVENGEIPHDFPCRLIHHHKRPACKVVDDSRIPLHVRRRVGTGPPGFHEAGDVLVGSVGLHIRRQVRNPAERLADDRSGDVDVGGVTGPAELHRLKHVVRHGGIRPRAPVKTGKQHVGIGRHDKVCRTGIERRRIPINVDIGHLPSVIVEVRSHTIPRVDRGLCIARRSHERVGRDRDVAPRIRLVGDRDGCHDGQCKPLLELLGRFELLNPVSSLREPSMRPTTIRPLPIRNTGPLREKRVEDVHDGTPIAELAVGKCVSNAAENKKSRRERTPVCSLAPALALLSHPASAGLLPQLVFRHISYFFDGFNRLRHLRTRLQSVRHCIHRARRTPKTNRRTLREAQSEPMPLPCNDLRRTPFFARHLRHPATTASRIGNVPTGPGISAEPLCGGATNWRLAWDHRVSTLKLCSSCTSNFGAWAGSVARTIAGRRS